MFLSLEDEEEGYGSDSKGDEKACGHPMCNSLWIPILDAVTESQCDEAHADKADSAQRIEKLVFVAEFVIHILCVGNDGAACKNAPEPEVSLVILAEKRQSAQLGSGVIAPEKRKCESVNKSEQKPDNTQGLVKDFFSVHKNTSMFLIFFIL